MLFIDLTVNGLITGVFYALMAIGLTLIFGILKIVNFAHGEFYMVGAYAYIMLSTALGLSVWISLPVAIALGTVIGWTTERALMSPLYAAGYYSYTWSHVYAEDIFTKFEENGFMDSATGTEYRQKILAPGGSLDPDDMVRSFLGREMKTDAFMKSLGLDGE